MTQCPYRMLDADAPIGAGGPWWACQRESDHVRHQLPERARGRGAWWNPVAMEVPVSEPL